MFKFLKNKYGMTFGEFLVAESKNCPVKPNSPLCKDLLSKMKTLLNSGQSVSVVLKGKPYTISLNVEKKIVFKLIK